MSRKPKSVVKSWLSALSIKEQSVLLLALRGCDTSVKDDPSKRVTRALRWLCLHNGNPDPGSFMLVPFADHDDMPYDPPLQLKGIDGYPMHWYMHTVHAAEIVAYRHPDQGIRKAFLAVYEHACREHLHMTPETVEQMTDRLREQWDNPCEAPWQ